MLRDTSPLEEWAARVDLPLSLWRAVNSWVQRLADTPWQAPSVPDVDVSDQPNYEVRSGFVPGTEVEVVYRHQYNVDEDVWLIAIVDHRRL